MPHHISIQLLSTDTLKEGEDCCHCKRNGQKAEGNTSLPEGRQRVDCYSHIKHKNNTPTQIQFYRSRTDKKGGGANSMGLILDSAQASFCSLRTDYKHYKKLWQRPKRLRTSVTRRRPRKKQTEQRHSSSSSRRQARRNTVGNMSVTEVIRHSRLTNCQRRNQKYFHETTICN